MKVFPQSVIPGLKTVRLWAIAGDDCAVLWEWPKGKMAWFWQRSYNRCTEN